MKRKATRPYGEGSVRIIAGSLRGRKVEVSDQAGLRPSGERIRETLFNWLQFRLNGKRVLDTFAGSGILGIEALSRGACAAVFMDSNEQLCANINRQLAAFNIRHAYVIQTDSYRASPLPQGFDLIFLDPPFADRRLQEALDHLYRELRRT